MYVCIYIYICVCVYSVLVEFCDNGFLKIVFTTSTTGRKEGNVLFNGTLNTFYLRLYGIEHMVKIERKPAAATWAILSD